LRKCTRRQMDHATQIVCFSGTTWSPRRGYATVFRARMEGVPRGPGQRKRPHRLWIVPARPRFYLLARPFYPRGARYHRNWSLSSERSLRERTLPFFAGRAPTQVRAALLQWQIWSRGDRMTTPFRCNGLRPGSRLPRPPVRAASFDGIHARPSPVKDRVRSRRGRCEAASENGPRSYLDDPLRATRADQELWCRSHHSPAATASPNGFRPARSVRTRGSLHRGAERQPRRASPAGQAQPLSSGRATNISSFRRCAGERRAGLPLLSSFRSPPRPARAPAGADARIRLTASGQ